MVANAGDATAVVAVTATCTTYDITNATDCVLKQAETENSITY